MSDGRGHPPAADAGFALRRALLFAAGERSTLQDRIDCAGAAIAADRQDIARILYDMAFVRAGFAPATIAWQAGLRREAALLDDAPAAPPAPQPQPQRPMVDLAVEEFARLPQTSGAAGTVPGRIELEPAARSAGAATPRLARLAPRHALAPALEEVGQACARLCELLRQAPGSATIEALAGLIQQLRGVFVDTLPFDPATCVGDIDRLAATCLAADLSDFLLRNYALAYAPSGSAEMLHAAARLAPTGLGAYLTNVRRIVRNGRDILGLVQLAAGEAPSAEELSRGVTLLSAHLDEHMLNELIDELGDRGLRPQLEALLAVIRHSARAMFQPEPLWRLRDAGLDLADLRLAADAQQVLAQWAIDDATEWTILSDIHATAGAFEQASEALAIATQIDPGVRSLAAPRMALPDRSGELFTVQGGYGSPIWRQQLRAARRE